MHRWLKDNASVWAIGLVIAVITASSAPWWWRYVWPENRDLTTTTKVVGFTGGCKAFRVYAQNRWEPYGTRRLVGPDPLARQVGGYAANQLIAVNGWVHGDIAYPYNSPPYNSDVWFHVADGSGWVSFAGVRELPTEPDLTRRGYGGPPAPTLTACQGAAH
ncbi:MAG: hypothetical protein QOG53_3146 [Frankiales bacterium]|nr:hypothetical protein [Frankiales bacterium]